MNFLPLLSWKSWSMRLSVSSLPGRSCLFFASKNSWVSRTAVSIFHWKTFCIHTIRSELNHFDSIIEVEDYESVGRFKSSGRLALKAQSRMTGSLADLSLPLF